MPKHKKDETKFIMNIWNDRDQSLATIPKVLMNRIEQGEKIVGTFALAIQDKKPIIYFEIQEEK